MCHFVTAVLPKSAPHADLDAIARKFGRQFRPLSNPSVESQIATDESYFITTTGHCDCGTPLGALTQLASRTPDWPALEARLLKKGWGKNKVARSIEQKQQVCRETTESSAEAIRVAATSWSNFILAVLASGKTARMGLLLHMYSGSLESRVDIAGRRLVRADEISPDFLGSMKEDVLYVFHD